MDLTFGNCCTKMVVPNENKANDNRRRWRKKEKERSTYSSSVITNGFVPYSSNQNLTEGHHSAVLVCHLN